MRRNEGSSQHRRDKGYSLGQHPETSGGWLQERLYRALSDDLTKLPHLLSFSRQAMRTIKQNLIFSLSVLAIAVGLASPGILLPVTGALLHELSSIPVIANSARLIRTKE